MKNIFIGGVLAGVVLLGVPFAVFAEDPAEDAATLNNTNSTGGGTQNSGTTGGGTQNSGTTGGGTYNPGGGTSGSEKLQNPLSTDANYNLLDFLRTIIDVILVFAIPIIVLYIMYSGFLFVTAQGEPGKVQEARRAFTYAIIGGVIVLGAWAILEAVKGTVDAIVK